MYNYKLSCNKTRAIMMICIIFTLACVVLFAGCGKGVETDGVTANKSAEYEQPEKVVAKALDKLKKGTYDTAFIFDGERCSDTLNRELYAILFKNFDYKILSQTENKDGSASVTVEIANLDFSKIVKDFSKLKIDKKQLAQMSVKDKEDVIIEQLQKVTDTFSDTLDVKLVKGAKHYQILNKADMYTAASGHYLNAEYPSASNDVVDEHIGDGSDEPKKTQDLGNAVIGGPKSTLSEEADLPEDNEDSTTEKDNK